MSRLTEQEQQEIIRFLEADKPLPDKFRFLLFEDKREVELVWNGKSSEVSSIVLPFQVIEQVDEPRAEKSEDTSAQGLLFDERDRQRRMYPSPPCYSNGRQRPNLTTATFAGILVRYESADHNDQSQQRCASSEV
jgi:hypothetical protein